MAEQASRETNGQKEGALQAIRSDPFRFSLTKKKRVLIAFGALILAALHLFYPGVQLDVVSVGLMGLALVVLFAKIEKIKLPWLEAWFGEEMEKVGKAELPQLPERAPDAPVIEAKIAEDIQVKDVAKIELVTPTIPSGSTVHPPTIHAEPTGLFPPTEPGEFLLWAVSNIGNELLVLAGNSGQGIELANTFPRVKDISSFSVYLAQRNIIPGTLLSSIRMVVDSRNALVRSELAGEHVEKAADLSGRVLSTLGKIERYYYRVRMPSVDLYLDRDRTARHETSGVMIVTLDKNGRVKGEPHVFPRVFDFRVGRFVTWEWDMTRAFMKEAWYTDPVDDTPKLAFQSAATFAGREYPDQWGLEYRLPRPDVGLLEKEPT